jgi:O-methyltransferase
VAGRRRHPVVKRLERALGLGWTYPRGKIPPLQVFGRRMLERMADRYGMYLTTSMSTPYKPLAHRVFMRDTPVRMHLDYVRYATAELLCREVIARGLTGNIGEVGVYQGWWARVVNYHLPDRTIYLFDTFKGFDQRDLEGQAHAGLSTDAPYEVGEIDPREALQGLPHPEQAVIRAGWFPATAEGLEDETFCLVDVDTGLYEPTLAGLRWFYPRLVPGGFLSVVDYNNAHTQGVRPAVEQFVAESGADFVVVPDLGACALFVKPRGAKAS